MEDREITIGNWILIYLLMCIPLVNLIMLFVWAFGSSAPVSQANWAKAQLIFMLLLIVVVFLFGGLIGAALMSSGY